MVVGGFQSGVGKAHTHEWWNRRNISARIPGFHRTCSHIDVWNLNWFSEIRSTIEYFWEEEWSTNVQVSIYSMHFSEGVGQLSLQQCKLTLWTSLKKKKKTIIISQFTLPSFHHSKQTFPKSDRHSQIWQTFNSSSTQKLPTDEKGTHKQEVPIEIHYNQFPSLESHSVIENESKLPHITAIPRDNDGRMNTSPTNSVKCSRPMFPSLIWSQTAFSQNRLRCCPNWIVSGFTNFRGRQHARNCHTKVLWVHFSAVGNFCVELSFVKNVSKVFPTTFTTDRYINLKAEMWPKEVWNRERW
jgi:hypothetical protein